MRHLYTVYLEYPFDIDQAIRTEYEKVTSKWSDWQNFEFKPRIPLWKVILSEPSERQLVTSISSIDLSSLHDLRIMGYESREDSGYIFLVFDEPSSSKLTEISTRLSQLMQVGDAEDHMPYGFAPHTSLIKQDPLVIAEIQQTLTHDLHNVVFTPSNLVVSKEIRLSDSVEFEAVLSKKI